MTDSLLTPDDVAVLERLRATWAWIGLETERADRETAERAVTGAYGKAGLEPPATLLWLDSPLAGYIAAASLTGFIDSAPTPAPEEGHLVRGDLGDFIARVHVTLERQVPVPARIRLRDRSAPPLLERVIRHRPELAVDHEVLMEAARRLGTPLGLVYAGLSNALISQVRKLASLPRRAQAEQHRLDRQSQPISVGQHDGHMALYVFADRLGIDVMPALEETVTLARWCGWVWAFEELAILTERPGVQTVDDKGWLHGERAPAIAFADGFELYAWHGVTGLAPKVITAPDSLTLSDIEAEAELVRRRVMIERLGPARYRELSEQARPELRWVSYRPVPGVGPGPGPARTARLDDFVLALPYRLSEYVPLAPLVVLNTLLRAGRIDAGMSGGAEWESFEIGESEYGQLADALQRASYRVGPEPPAWVENYSDWSAWCLEGDEGGPLTRRLRG